MSIPEICSYIGADSLGYLSVESVNKIANGAKCGFCDACFTGNYPVDPPQATDKNKFECKLSERKQK